MEKILMKIIKLPNGGVLEEYSNGDKYYFLNDKLRGDKWNLKNKLHREDGPAVEFASGYKEWYLNGKLIPCKTQKEFEQLIRLRAFW
jgi:hypothetical protein